MTEEGMVACLIFYVLSMFFMMALNILNSRSAYRQGLRDGAFVGHGKGWIEGVQQATAHRRPK